MTVRLSRLTRLVSKCLQLMAADMRDRRPQLMAAGASSLSGLRLSAGPAVGSKQRRMVREPSREAPPGPRSARSVRFGT